MTQFTTSLAEVRASRKFLQTQSLSNDHSAGILDAAGRLVSRFTALAPLDAPSLRQAMTAAFGLSDDVGGWKWKDAYDAAETALIKHLLDSGSSLFGPDPFDPAQAASTLEFLNTLAALEPTHSRRSRQQQEYQQFSTPIAIAWCAFIASRMNHSDTLLEPSAGTGMLSVFPTLFAPQTGIHLNEYARTRAGILANLFPRAQIHHCNAETIADRLPHIRPSLIIMNPPFSVSPDHDKRVVGADLAHVRSAFSMLPEGGRLVAITAASRVPGTAAWNELFGSLSGAPATCVFTTVMEGCLYARRGTSFDTRMTVIDRSEHAADADRTDSVVSTPQELLEAVLHNVPTRQPISHAAPPPLDLFGADTRPSVRRGPDRPVRKRKSPPTPSGPPAASGDLGLGAEQSSARDFGPISELTYTRSIAPAETTTGSYASWQPTVIDVPGAQTHPTHLIQSAAMAAVSHAEPAYRPLLPESLVTDNLLSDAQLESVVLAGAAHERLFPDAHQIQASFDKTRRASADQDPSANQEPSNDPEADPEDKYGSPVHFRYGWMLGDGTGAGKGRQVAGILLDNWLRGRRRALWLSQSDKLVEDARRDWLSLGGMATDVFPLTKFRQDVDIPFDQGILFATYATLRSAGRSGKQSRLQQIIRWLAGSMDETDRHAFDGVIVFDESHAMSNAAGGKGSRGDTKPSQQGIAGIRLQNALPQSRVLLVSATGASTLSGLAYAVRLGLWGSGDTPFDTRDEFLAAMTAGGVAALEVISRDLKALGLYQSRALSYDGVEIDILEHPLTDEQRTLYDEWAHAFRLIHHNLDAAMEASGITKKGSTLNRGAKSSAISTFESIKQRFFAHMLNAMKCPSLIRSVTADLNAGRSAVIQLVSTGESLMERQLAEIPPSEWDDIQIDLTPRDNIIEYLKYAFPVQLQETYTDDAGNECSRPVFDADDNRVLCQEAVAKRDKLILKMASLPSTPSALDQIVHHFGHDNVAEITGRGRRIVKIDGPGGGRFALRGRPASANLTEANDFMHDKKRILVFSNAGDTGRSYHADLSVRNQRRRVHYLLEPGWRADRAIQGLGRTHRTHQASAPVFRPVTTDVKGERRFTATIARRLDALGALTRGQRNSQTEMAENQSLFRPEDNFESTYARMALRQFYVALYLSHISNWNEQRFYQATGLRITDKTGELKKELPSMSRTLNRLLAMPIDEQNQLFSQLEQRIDANVARAIEAGNYEQGVETLSADSFTVATREEVLVTNATRTELVEIVERNKLIPLTADQAIARAGDNPPQIHGQRFAINTRSGRAAALARTSSVMDDESGRLLQRIALVRPDRREPVTLQEWKQSNWKPCNEEDFRKAWENELATLPAYRERRRWLATGMLLPVWQKLPQENMRVRRLTTDDGESLIGRVLEENEIDQVRSAFGLAATGTPPPQRMFAILLDGKRDWRLHNGWRLLRRQVAGSPRVELDGPVHSDHAKLERLGANLEIIAYRGRVFLPSPEVLASVIETWPVQA